MTIDGQSSYVVGLNQIGLKRAGYDIRTIARLKEAYRVIYRSGLAWKDVLENSAGNSPRPPRRSSCRFSQRPSGASSPSGGCRPGPRSASMRRKSRSPKPVAQGGVRLFLRVLALAHDLVEFLVVAGIA